MYVGMLDPSLVVDHEFTHNGASVSRDTHNNSLAQQKKEVALMLFLSNNNENEFGTLITQGMMEMRLVETRAPQFFPE